MATRKIAFRAWDKKERVMRFVLRIEWNTDYPDKLEYVETYPLRRLLPSEVELLQFTGLKDKAGKEIYEGDIISWDDHRDDPMCRSEIIFDDGCFRARGPSGGSSILSQCSDWPQRIEVIGNVWEHPELVK